MREIHWWPVNSPHKWPVTQKNVYIWWRHAKEERGPNYVWAGVHCIRILEKTLRDTSYYLVLIQVCWSTEHFTHNNARTFSESVVLLILTHWPQWKTWWRHQMETFSALLAICAGTSLATGEFPAQQPVTRSFDVFFDQCLKQWLSKQSWGWCIETPSRPLWRHYNDLMNIFRTHRKDINRAFPVRAEIPVIPYGVIGPQWVKFVLFWNLHSCWTEPGPNKDNRSNVEWWLNSSTCKSSQFRGNVIA